MVNEIYVKALEKPKPDPVAPKAKKTAEAVTGESFTQTLVSTGFLRRTREFLNNRLRTHIFRVSLNLPPNHELFDKVFSTFLSEANYIGAEVTLLYLPPTDHILRHVYSDSQFSWLQDFAKRKGVKLVTVSEAFRRERDLSSLFGGGLGPHYSAKGYAIVGHTLAQELGF